MYTKFSIIIEFFQRKSKKKEKNKKKIKKIHNYNGSANESRIKNKTSQKATTTKCAETKATTKKIKELRKQLHISIFKC